jgi:hypothetical protein
MGNVSMGLMVKGLVNLTMPDFYLNTFVSRANVSMGLMMKGLVTLN